MDASGRTEVRALHDSQSAAAECRTGDAWQNAAQPEDDCNAEHSDDGEDDDHADDTRGRDDIVTLRQRRALCRKQQTHMTQQRDATGRSRDPCSPHVSREISVMRTPKLSPTATSV